MCHFILMKWIWAQNVDERCYVSLSHSPYLYLARSLAICPCLFSASEMGRTSSQLNVELLLLYLKSLARVIITIVIIIAATVVVVVVGIHWRILCTKPTMNNNNEIFSQFQALRSDTPTITDYNARDNNE